MIESGNKKEEYREIKKYWIGRLAKCGGRNSYEKTGFYCKKAICFSCITRGNGFHPKEYTHVRFRFGYTKRTMLFELESITIGVGNTNWGAPDNECVFILNMDIEEITAGRKKAILMDNNILASNYGLQQIEKIIKLGIKVDFNQGLDARLITDEIARLLAKVKWIKRIRFGCDTPGQIAEVERASALIDKYGYKGEYFLYCILMDFEESFARVNYWKSKSRRFLPHCQPFRDLNNPHQIIPQWQKDMAHWADRKEIYMSCDFKDFSPRKGFLCKEYFKIL